MNRWLSGVLIAVVLVVGAQHMARTQPGLWGARMTCDGNFPRWVLEAQNYDGGGCAYELPWFLAPPGADWTTYCTMWCEPMWPPSD